MCARVGCETTHFTARSKQKERVVVFVMCIWDAQRKRSNGGGATRFEFLNFHILRSFRVFCFSEGGHFLI